MLDSKLVVLVAPPEARFENTRSFSAMRHTMTHCANLIKRFDNTVLRVSQHVENKLDTFLVGWNRGLHVAFFLADGFVGELTHFQTNAFYQTFS